MEPNIHWDEHCEFSDAGFRATAVQSCGSRIIRVAGAGLAPSSGWTLDLAATNPGIVAHPDSLWLVLTEHPPVAARSRFRTAIPVEAIIEDCQAAEIVVRFGWRDPIVVPVADAETAAMHPAARANGHAGFVARSNGHASFAGR